MWILLYLYFCSGCEVIVDQLNIFPIKEEIYELPLEELFSGFNLSYSCQNCPDSVIIKNTFHPLQEIENYGFTSRTLSQNETHFASLTNEGTLNVYTLALDLIVSVSLNQQLQCFNAIFQIYTQIILDCYFENKLQFYVLDQQELINLQNFSSQTPIQTKMMPYLVNGIEALLYSQKFEIYSYLTLFVKNGEYYDNKTVWEHQVADFSISDKGFIYILATNVGIYQVIINEKYQFQILTCRYSVENYVKIQVFASLSLQSQYDTLIVADNDYQTAIQKFAAWEGQIAFAGDFDSYFEFNSSSYLWFGISDYFLVIQQNNYFTVNSALIIYQKNLNNSLFKIQKTNKNQIYCYLNPINNYMYEFSNVITISTLQNPQLIGQFQQIQKQKIILSASQVHTPIISQICKINLNYQIVDYNDSKIYQVYNQYFPHFLLQDTSIKYIIDSFSGQFQQVSAQLQNQELGQFIDLTLQKLNFTFSEKFEITKMYYCDQFIHGGYIFAGTILTKIYLYFCDEVNCSLFYSNQYEQNISQIVFSFDYISTILIAINQGDNEIILIKVILDEQLQFSNFTMVEQSFQVQPFHQFTLTFSSVVLLLKSNKVQSLVLNSASISELNQQTFEDIFKTNSTKFNPKLLVSNQQNQASIIFINNQNSIIIVGLTFQNRFIPFSIINIGYEIQSINIVNEQLVIAYFNQNLLCFQVFKLYNLYKPEFQKTLPCTGFAPGWEALSDNVHFYVYTNQDNYLIVYNPAQPYHNSQFYRMQLKQTPFSAINVYATSFIYNSQTIYQLYPYFLVQFESSFSLPSQYLFNTNQIISVKSLLNESNNIQVSNYLIIINPLTEIQKQTYKFPFQKLETLTININELINEQIITYTPQERQSSHDFLCNFTQFFYGSSNETSQNYTIVISYQSEIILQSNSQLYIPFTQQIITYQNNFTKCLISSIFQNQLYSICQALETSYLTAFNITNNFTIIQLFDFLPLPLSCQIIIKFTQYEYLTMILGQNIIIQDYYVIHIYNIYNFSNVTLLNITCSFGIQDFTFQYLFSQGDGGQVFAIFYICKDSLFYKFGYLNLLNNQFSIDENQHEVLLNEKRYHFLKYTQLLQIVSLGVQENEILLFLSTTNITNVFFTMTFNKQLYAKNQLQLQDILSSIPPYGSYSLSYSAQVSNEILVLLFNSTTERVYALYNFTKLKKSLSTPLIMLGGVSQQLPLPQSIALSVNPSTLQIQLYDITNGSIYFYNFYQSNFLTCEASAEIKTDQFYYINISNSFSQGTIEIIFQYHKETTTYWIYLLVVIIITSVFAFIYTFTKNPTPQREKNLEEEFEL